MKCGVPSILWPDHIVDVTNTFVHCEFCWHKQQIIVHQTIAPLMGFMANAYCVVIYYLYFKRKNIRNVLFVQYIS